MSISQQIKDAIRKSGKTLLQIERDTGVSNATLGRFLSEDPAIHRDIRLEKTADKLAEYFGLKLTKDRGGAKKKKG